jgi:energy-coupling factor transporter ATP-binding protein EcfA2
MKDKTNRITGLYFRSTVNDSDQKHFYLKDSRGLYPHYPNPQTEKLIITESIIDAASLLQIREITEEYSILAAYGTNRLTEEIKAGIGELKTLSEIVFVFDTDEAGRKAALKYGELLKVAMPQITYSTVELPCKDVNETLQAHKQEIFIHLLEKRTLLFSSESVNAKKEVQSAEKEKEPITNQSSLNSSNPYKLIYQSERTTYVIKGGVDKVMSKLSITLEIINCELNEGISKRRFKLDLYDTKQVEKTVEEAAEYLQLTKSRLERDIDELTENLDEYREGEIQQASNKVSEPGIYILSPNERNEALNLSRSKELIQTIQSKLSQSGIIGEEENKTFLYIIAASHIQENPLNALIQGSSGSGKTNLLKGIYKTMPEENKKIYSRLSEKMLYNVPKYYFKNKLICFEDVDGLGEEAEYAWRELVSSGELVSGVSYKDEKGNIGIKELTVYGPITSIACTTKGSIYADNMSRLFLMATDESKAQTKKINQYQGQEAAGLIDKAEQQKAIKELQNFIRILTPYKVYNPFAINLKLPEGIQDERRIYKLYLHFIEIITVLHQYQRKKTKDQKLITEKQDCQIAKDLLFECIMLKMDELDGSLRQFFERLKEYINKQNSTTYEFTQREIRAALNVKKTQLSYYINELQSLEYIQQTSTHINKGNRYKILHFDNYRKMREEVKAYLQKQIDEL